MTEGRHNDLSRTVLAVTLIAALVIGSIWILSPFLPALLWAITLVLATWPLMLRIQHVLGDRRGLAVTVMTVLLLLLLILPFWLAISTILENTETISSLARGFLSLRMQPPPDWLVELPWIGPRAGQLWTQFGAIGLQDIAPKLTPYAGQATQWFVAAAGGLGGVFVTFLLTVIIAAILYANGERAGAYAVRFGRRLAGARGEAAVRLAGNAIRGVAMGVVVTSLLQSVLGGLSLALVGVPFAAVLTAVMFMLCLAQIGPGLVLIPTIIWMYVAGDTVWATVLLLCSVVVLTMDNFVRPVLIRRGADLPILLIFAGVIGGLAATGLVGIFLGPTILAVTYTLTNAWLDEGEFGFD